MKIATLSNIVRPVAIAWLLLLPAVSWGDTLPLAADAFINPGDGSNYGGLPTINVGGAPNSRGLLLFNLSSLSGSQVAWARLRVYVNSVTSAGTVDLGAASAPWAEAAVNGIGGPGVGSPITTAPLSAIGYVTFDVTAQVTAWLAGSPNNGFILTADSTTPGVTVYFDAKENPATSHPATLEVVFSGPAGPAGPQGAQGVTGPIGATGAIGVTGPIGATGVGGPGPTGPSGTRGPTGPTGPVGAQGPSGASGAFGLAGAFGATGPTGAVGATGASGATGAQGLAGPAGPIGASGPPGPPGAAGATGPSFSNVLSFNPNSILTGTIPDNSISVILTSVGSTITLPHASTLAGKKIWIIPTNPSAGQVVTIQRQSPDLIFWSKITTEPGAGLTSITNGNPVQLFSDGANWIVTYINAPAPV